MTIPATAPRKFPDGRWAGRSSGPKEVAVEITDDGSGVAAVAAGYGH